MSVHTGSCRIGLTNAERDLGPALDPTYWGYVIRAGKPQRKLGQVYEAASKFLGAILVLAGAGLWVMPEALYSSDVIAMKIGTTVIFLILGSVLVWTARVGFNDELQVDLVRSELRLGQRNTNGDFRLKVIHKFSDIRSVYLLRSKAADLPTRLFLRVQDGQLGLEVASGCEDVLTPLKDRLTEDLSAVHGVGPSGRARPRLPGVALPQSA